MTLAGIRKAITPALIALVALIVEWVQSGTFNAPEYRTVAAGAIAALFVYFVPNDETALPR